MKCPALISIIKTDDLLACVHVHTHPYITEGLSHVYLPRVAMSKSLLARIGKHKSSPLVLTVSGYDLRRVRVLAYFSVRVCEWVLTVTGLSHSPAKGHASDSIEQR